MKKSLALLALASVAVLGLSACSGSTEPEAPETSVETPAPETPEAPEAPAEEPAGQLDAETLQACMDLQAPMQKALEEMMAIQASGGNGIEKWQAGWAELEKALDGIANTASLDDVKDAAAAAHTDAVTVGKIIERAATGDVATATEIATAQTDFQASYSALLGFCTPTSGS